MTNPDALFPDLVARLDENCRELFEERAAIREFDGYLPRQLAEVCALLDVVRLHPMALVPATVLRVASGGAILFVLSSRPDHSAGQLAAMGLAVSGTAELAVVLDEFNGTAVVSRLF